jgi:hypothetical protein
MSATSTSVRPRETSGALGISVWFAAQGFFGKPAFEASEALRLDVFFLGLATARGGMLQCRKQQDEELS